MGKRRPWLIIAQLTMLICLASIALVTDVSTDFQWLLRLVLVANVFVGLQDVCVDAMAVDLLTSEDRERVSGLMYAASYMGTAIGGAGLGWVIGRYGFPTAILCQCGLLAISALLPICVRERRGDRLLPGSSSNEVLRDSAASPVASNRFLRMGKDLSCVFRLRSTLIGAVVALLVKIGYGMVAPSFAKHLRDAAGWSTERYTEIEGFWGSVAGLSACCLGAFAAQRFGAKSVTVLGLLALSAMWVLVGLRPELLAHDLAAAGVIVLQEALLALVSVGLFAIYCAISWPRIAAIQFTGYMALLNFSMTLGSKLAGHAASIFDLSHVFILAGCMQAVLVSGVLWIDLGETRAVLGDE